MTPAKPRCVIVDDDRDFLQHVRRWFEVECTDVEVQTFSSSVEALEYIRQTQVDMILTAYLVPQIDGLQLISIVRSFNTHVPICMMSRVPMQAEALARGATTFWVKSAVWSELGAAVAKLRSQAGPLAA